MAPTELYLNTLNGVTFAMLLFLVASGLTVIFGCMRVLNLSHGAIYMLGTYSGYLVQQETSSFLLAVAIAPVVAGAAGWTIDRLLRARLYAGELTQVLLTIGLALIISDAIFWARGGAPVTLQEPGFLSGATSLPGGIVFPTYRLAILGVGVLVAIVLALLWQRSKLGAMLRAGVDDAATLEAVGINVRRLFSWTFVSGSALAGFAGAIGGAFLGLYVGLDFDILLYSIVIVVLGGLGSLRGALIGALIIGLVHSYSTTYVPEFSYFAVFAPAILLLAFRPRGLFGAG